MGIYEKRYELTDETKYVKGRRLHRIRAVRDFYTINPYFYDQDVPEDCLFSAEGAETPCVVIKKGSLGGWIENEKNLSQEGFCWVAEEACVYDHAKIRDAAVVFGMAHVYGYASVDGFARVFGQAKVYGNASVLHQTMIYEMAQVSTGMYRDEVRVYGLAIIGRSPCFIDGWSLKVKNQARIHDCARIYDECREDNMDFCIEDWAVIGGNACISFRCATNGEYCIGRNTIICGNENIIIDEPKSENNDDPEGSNTI